LYNLLINIDDVHKYYDKYRLLNMMIEEYVEQKSVLFTIDEIVFLCNSKLICKELEDFRELHSQFLQKNLKSLKEDEKFTIDIYEKLKSINLLQKYNLYTLLENTTLSNKKDDENKQIIQHYFRNFLYK